MLKCLASILIPQLYNALASLFADAGLPDGALQIINFSEEDVAQRVEQLIADPLVRVSRVRIPVTAACLIR
jgi:acyl-CoA reductase-like NAD-dependent aldehyde dehydrogenase